MEHVETSIELWLNAAGYNGSDIDDIKPDFMAKHNVTISLSIEPAHSGAESWAITILVGLVVTEFLKEFAKNLSKDLYNWSKQKLRPFFEKKPSASGSIRLKLKDVDIGCPYWYVDNSNKLFDFLEQLPNLVKKVDPKKSNAWDAHFTEESKAWEIKPQEIKNYSFSNGK
ncbi:MAG: hypothetical protein ACRCYY_15695 [Trueperaceae bacterium]